MDLENKSENRSENNAVVGGEQHCDPGVLEERIEREIEKVEGNIEELIEDLVDLEELAIQGRRPPRAKHYRIRIDGQKYTVEVPGMTGRELLNLAGKVPPEAFMIVEKVRGQKPRRISLDEYVDFTKPGVEKFITQPLGQTEG
jgi:hypothetical protein